MEPSVNQPVNGNVHVAKFVLDGKEGKTGHSYKAKKRRSLKLFSLRRMEKIKRTYAMLIEVFRNNTYATFL